MEEPRWISIAAYFKVNGIKVSKPEEDNYGRGKRSTMNIIELPLGTNLTEQMKYWQEQYDEVWGNINNIMLLGISEDRIGKLTNGTR